MDFYSKGACTVGFLAACLETPWVRPRFIAEAMPLRSCRKYAVERDVSSPKLKQKGR